MIETLDFSDGSHAEIKVRHDHSIGVSVRTPLGVLSPMQLSLEDVEALQRLLGKAASKLRGEEAAPVGATPALRRAKAT